VPPSENLIEKIVEEELKKFEEKLHNDGVFNKKRKRPREANPVMNRYFTPQPDGIAAIRHHVSMKIGKPLLQTIVQRLAHEGVQGQDAYPGGKETDIFVYRNKSFEWIERFCISENNKHRHIKKYKPLEPPRPRESATRTYVVQLKAMKDSESGSTTPLTKDAMLNYVLDKRDDDADVVGVYCGVFGTTRPVQISKASADLYVVSGRQTIDLLLDDEYGICYDIFYQAFERTPVFKELEAVLYEDGYLFSNEPAALIINDEPEGLF
jgi:hypothetical protein